MCCSVFGSVAALFRLETPILIDKVAQGEIDWLAQPAAINDHMRRVTLEGGGSVGTRSALNQGASESWAGKSVKASTLEIP